MVNYPPDMAPREKLVIETDRQRVLSFRLSESEYAQIQARASEQGLKVTQYVRSLALRDSSPLKRPD